MYPPRARLRALRYAEAGKAGLRAETRLRPAGYAEASVSGVVTPTPYGVEKVNAAGRLKVCAPFGAKR